ncbi:hypothetical protein FHS42_002333 [Streptomyces zagrosensis]|uniref:Uncharacterized protein n=1 Tax=Streptomyces zagrosensis TaxID=1042984 RepID=A0A7W9UXV4_9ACTN|nr:hypothetical protein [Streptomyces zagrosensis]
MSLAAGLSSAASLPPPLGTASVAVHNQDQNPDGPRTRTRTKTRPATASPAEGGIAMSTTARQ